MSLLIIHIHRILHIILRLLLLYDLSALNGVPMLYLYIRKKLKSLSAACYYHYYYYYYIPYLSRFVSATTTTLKHPFKCSINYYLLRVLYSELLLFE